MRRFVVTAAGLAAALALTLVALGFPAEAAEPQETRGVTVSGTDTVLVAPDTAQWSFGVHARAADARVALRSATRRMRAVVAAVRAAGVGREDVRTEAVSVYPNLDEGKGAVSGYVASATVAAVVRPVSRAGAVVQAAVEAGATDVYGPSLSRSDADALYDRALARAYAHARAKAERLAAAMGVALGRPLAVVEGGGVAPEPYAGAEAAAARDVVEPGRTEVGATVTVTFAIA
jgi:uncharacterized protein YggE